MNPITNFEVFKAAESAVTKVYDIYRYTLVESKGFKSGRKVFVTNFLISEAMRELKGVGDRGLVARLVAEKL